MKKTLVTVILIAIIAICIAAAILAFMTGKDLWPKCKRCYEKTIDKIKSRKVKVA